MVRLIITLVSVVALILGTAGAANAAGNAKGHLILSIDGVATTVAPGQAVKQAAAACVGRANVVVVTVADVRAAFPNPVTVCNGVTLTSQVPADAAGAATE